MVGREGGRKSPSGYLVKKSCNSACPAGISSMRVMWSALGKLASRFDLMAWSLMSLSSGQMRSLTPSLSCLACLLRSEWRGGGGSSLPSSLMVTVTGDSVSPEVVLVVELVLALSLVVLAVVLGLVPVCLGAAAGGGVG